MRRVSFLLAIVLIASGAWTPATAQVPSDEWEFVVSPYFLGAAMSGTTTVRGLEVDVDLSTSDILSNLQFGAMGIVAARKGNWGFGTDLIWMALGTTVRETNVDFNQGAFAFYGLRRLSPAAEVTFGMRVNTLQGDLAFKRIGVDVSQSKTWVDPIVGLILRTPADRRVSTAGVHRNRRIRGRLELHMAGVPDRRDQAGRLGLLGTGLSLAGYRLLHGRGETKPSSTTC